MPHPRAARPIRSAKAGRSTLRRRRNKAWLRARVAEEIAGIAALIERKRAQERADAAAGPALDPRSGPASREDPCDEAANTPSMPR